MGEVHRARDTKLDRDVAIKVLPESFAADRDRVARFEREAKTLASLNHPNIGQIYGLEDANGVAALILELVEGPTLAERIARGAIPLDEALPIARQIADALEAAHEHDIVHRDLKPANVKLRRDGVVKVLDFGLAKVLGPPEGGHAVQDGRSVGLQPDLTATPTITSPAMMTGVGVILGTAVYMSPEQARGGTVDKRTDIWAFGCVLYEILTGKRAFDGEDVTDVLSRVLQRDPDFAALPATTPRMMRKLIGRCLQKDPRSRLRDIGDAKAELEPADEAWPTGAADGTRMSGKQQRRVGSLVGALLLVTAALASLSTWWMTRRSPAPPLEVLHASIALPAAAVPLTTIAPGIAGAGSYAAAMAISPQGTHVVYTGRAGDGYQLYVRSLDGRDVVPMEGATGGSPFFSPDGRWVAFFGDGKLKRVPVGGGVALTICDAGFGFGGAWGDDGTIVFAGGLQGGLSRVSVTGGQPQPFTTLAEGETAHRWPVFVPGTRDVVFAAGSGFNWDAGHVAIQSLDATEHRVLFEGGTFPRYTSTGHIVFARAGALLAVPFDAARRVTVGDPRVVLQGVSTFGLAGTAQYAVSTSGALVYLPGGVEDVRQSLVWVDRQGREQPASVAVRGFETPRMAPDGQRIAVTIREGDADIWVVAPERGTLTRITNEDGEDHSAVWTPDGKRITYSSTRADRARVRQKAADGSGSEEELLVADSHRHLGGWADARTLLTEALTSSGSDLRTITIGQKASEAVYLETRFNESNARLSPDARWVAYTSNESGLSEVYVQAFPDPSGRLQVSTNGGSEPVWARSGRELFYREGDKMTVVAIESGTAFKAAAPRVLFAARYASVAWGEANYDVSPSGQRFLMLRSEAQPAATELHLVLNWFEELRRAGSQ